MEQRQLGRSGLQVSALGFGCMGMSEFYGASDDRQSLTTLERALELGINFFDTADTYGFGHNESLLGGWLKAGGPARRQQVVIASKFGIVREEGKYERRIDNSQAYIQSACDASLQRSASASTASTSTTATGATRKCRSRKRWVPWRNWCRSAR